MSMESLYEAGRDVNGSFNSCVTWYAPDKRLTIVFAGYDWVKNRQRFIDHYGLDFPLNCRVDTSVQQEITFIVRKIGEPQ